MTTMRAKAVHRTTEQCEREGARRWRCVAESQLNRLGRARAGEHERRDVEVEAIETARSEQHWCERRLGSGPTRFDEFDRRDVVKFPRLDRPVTARRVSRGGNQLFHVHVRREDPTRAARGRQVRLCKLVAVRSVEMEHDALVEGRHLRERRSSRVGDASLLRETRDVCSSRLVPLVRDKALSRLHVTPHHGNFLLNCVS